MMNSTRAPYFVLPSSVLLITFLSACEEKRPPLAPERPVDPGVVLVRPTAPFSVQWTLWGPDGNRIDGRDADDLLDQPVGAYRVVWHPYGGYFPGTPAADTLALAGGDTITFGATYSLIRRLTDDIYVEKRPAWSPDGANLVYDSDEGGDRGIWILDLATMHASVFYDDEWNNIDPDWSLDGYSILFVTRYSDYSRLEVKVYPSGASGSGINGQFMCDLEFLDDEIWSPSWSPDQSWVAFQAYYLWVVEVGGYGCEVVTAGCSNADFLTENVNWSRQGDRIAFGYWPDSIDNSRIATIEANGQNCLDITASSFNEYDPCWSPDDQYLCFVSNRAGFPDLWIARADGTPTLKRATQEEGAKYNPAWSPNGMAIVYEWRTVDSEQQDLWLVAVPALD